MKLTTSNSNNMMAVNMMMCMCRGFAVQKGELSY